VSPEHAKEHAKRTREVLPVVFSNAEAPCSGPDDLRTPRGVRKRDELFEALAAACGIDTRQLTRSARGPLNRALKDLRDVGATPPDVAARAELYRRQFKGVALTPTALAKHWAALVEGAAPLDAIDRAYLAAKRAGR
jgi:hypothetical protein